MPKELRHIDMRIRLKHGGAVVIGPGRADLLEGIAETGSIAAAGRNMGMSYKRAWMLIDSMNAVFGAPLVETNRGGVAGGGAVLTPFGVQILTLYQNLTEAAALATVEQRHTLETFISSRNGA